jgi:hypothetical protein
MPLQFDLSGTRKTLFGRQALGDAISQHPPPPAPALGVDHLRRWQMMLRDPARRGGVNEHQHAQTFLRDIFETLLGYPTAASADIYNLGFEGTGPGDARRADGIIGFLGAAEGDRVRAVVEVKRPGVDLDARSGRSDRLSAVDQAFLYASNFDDVRWALVTNFDEIRLYSHRRGKTVFEPFRTTELDGAKLREFLFLLRRENLLGDGIGMPPTERLAENIWHEQAAITQRFYAEFQEARVELFEELRRQNPEVGALEILSATQTLLDRVLFVLFCSDRTLLPPDVVRQILEHSRTDRFTWRPGAVWGALKSLFRAVDRGDPPSRIDGYNGGLFRESPLDSLRLDDVSRSNGFVLRRILSWDKYDFESQLDVDVLGHIFENSISDLEHLQHEIANDPYATRLHWRNRQGIFYTPEWVTAYVVRHAVERYLDENPQVGPDLKVVDPACGSGAFLTQLVPLFLNRIRQLAPDETARAEAALYAAEAQMGIFEDPGILGGEALYAAISRSVHGVDKSPESVEITKLSFWLKTAIRGRPLPTLDQNIQVGNSLVSDPGVADDAFSWGARLPRLAAGSTDVVIGNPPWGADASSYVRGLADYALARGQFDTAFVFVELAFGLLKEGGVLGFVVPDSILINEDLVHARRLIAEENTLLEVIKLGEGVFPGVFRGSAVLLVRKGRPPAEHRFRGLIVTKEDRREVTNIASSVDLDTLMERKGVTIRQARVLANPGLELDIFVGEEDEALLQKIERDTVALSAALSHGRGVELNSEGVAIRCPSCFRWDAPPVRRKGVYDRKTCMHCGSEYAVENALAQARLISPDDGVQREEQALYVDGTDVNRYRIERRRRIDISKDGINYKDGNLYASPKIVFRQAGIGITATLDLDWNAYVPQSVYIFRLREDRDTEHERYRLSYFLGVLNSRVMLYYYFKKTGQVEWQSFPRWTLGRVLGLPVPRIDWTDPRQIRMHDAIADAVEELVRRGGTGNPEEDLHIEQLVMTLYALDDGDRARVWTTLRAVQKLQIVREVLPDTHSSLV